MEVGGGNAAGWLVVREMEVGTWVVCWMGWLGLLIAIGSPGLPLVPHTHSLSLSTHTHTHTYIEYIYWEARASNSNRKPQPTQPRLVQPSQLANHFSPPGLAPPAPERSPRTIVVASPRPRP
jgi:hypothetical protein